MALVIVLIQNQGQFYCSLDNVKILFDAIVEFCVETRMKLNYCTWKQDEPDNIY